VFEKLYKSVESGEEARRTLEKNGDPDYRVKLEAELTEIRNMEMWQAGAQVRKLRPENQN
jgi:ketol-acid reductoisomerase